MAENKKNSIMSDPKQRMMFLALGGVVIVSIVGGLYFANSAEENFQPAGAQVAPVPKIETIPGSSTSADYNRKIQEENDRKAQEALSKNSSFVPTLTANNQVSDISPIDLAAQERERIRRMQEEKPPVLTPPPVVVQEPIPVIQPPPVVQYQPPVAPQPVQEVKKPKYSYEDYVIVAALTGAGKVKAPTSEFDYAGTGSGGSGGEGNYGYGPNMGMNGPNMGMPVSMDNGQGFSGFENQNLPIAKAGDILNAVLETSVNSDEPSPVMAKIVTGELKGTRLIGSVQTVGKKVVLQFSRANIPSNPTSVEISAVAVDPTTSRTALASDVDNHYLARYGLLIASQFLSGWSEAIAQNNTQTSVGPLGNIVVTPTGNMTSKDINRRAIGSVGTELANNARSNVNSMPPTITVDGGIAIGILLMDDLVIQ